MRFRLAPVSVTLDDLERPKRPFLEMEKSCGKLRHPPETRKPCYRKDDRAMRLIYGCPEKFRKSSQNAPGYFSRNL